VLVNFRKVEFVRKEREEVINKLLEFFRRCKRANEFFYWDAKTGLKTGEIVNIFWSHASQRAECKDFGDVITFDTTHKTNKHRMPLAMFVGSNHQLQNVVFGQALLRDESTESFEWLFTTFKECMGGHQPHVILTGDRYYWLDVFYVVWFTEKIVLFPIANEDPTMKIAIPKIFAKTHHRYCRFHVLRHWKYELESLY
jgi:hypothetical protein